MRGYFPNLNGLRFVAALLVIFSHVEQNKSFLSIPNYFQRPITTQLAELGVSIFFVLSGFLITILLLRESQTTGKISLKAFYTKRVLRIWPLYFLIVFLACVSLPAIPYMEIPIYSQKFERFKFQALPYLLLILPNVAGCIFGIIPFATQAWSIGAEEQFYIIWPLLLKKTREHVLYVCLLLFFFFIITQNLLYYITFSHSQLFTTQVLDFLNIFKEYYKSTKISLFSLGGLGAYLVNGQHPFLKWIFQTPVQIISYLVLAGGIVLGMKIHYVNDEFYALFILAILLNLSSNPTSLVKLETPVLNYLGKISYGLYMYHNIFLFLAIKGIASIIGFDHYWMATGISFLIGFGCTVLVSHFSFFYFESFFLRIKEQMFPLKSTP